MILRNDLKPAFVPKHANATHYKHANDSTTAPRSSGFVYGLGFPRFLFVIMRNDLKPAFVPKHTNATDLKPANDSTTAPRPSGFAYGLGFPVLSTGY